MLSTEVLMLILKTHIINPQTVMAALGVVIVHLVNPSLVHGLLTL